MEILVDDRIVASGCARKPKAGVLEMKLGDGSNGFEITLPAELLIAFEQYENVGLVGPKFLSGVCASLPDPPRRWVAEDCFDAAKQFIGSLPFFGIVERFDASMGMLQK